jgi:putative transposase
MGEKTQRKSYTNQLKARIALEAIKGQRTINEIASDYELHPNLVNQWKRLAVVKLQEAFSTRHDREAEKEEELRDRLYREIGQLKVELDWLKKNLDCTAEQKRAMIDPGNKEINIERSTMNLKGRAPKNWRS